MKTAILPLTVLILCSCEGVTSIPNTSIVDNNNDIERQYSYLYGNFKMSDSAARADGSYMSMAFIFECDDGNKYKIQLSIDNSVQLIQVNPSKCSSTKALFIAEDGSIYEEKEIPIGSLTDVNLKPGTAYYIGDYYAMAFRHIFSKKRRGSWNLKKIEDKYDETTQQLEKIYQISSVLKINNLLN